MDARRTSISRAAIFALLCVVVHQPAAALNNGLAKKPPLAYSNWNIVGPAVNESFIQAQAQALVDTGLAAAGYEYVIVDDCWSNVERGPDGKLQTNTTNFPSGMKALAAFIHARGLKFGMYADAGNMTCQFHPGSRGYEEVDAQSFADWGVDYLKYDNCHASADDNVVERYAAMSKALNKTGRPILYSIVGWGVGDPWTGWGKEYGNLWRTDGDITQSWAEITRVLDNSVGLMKYSEPYAWADMDMLEVGVGTLTFQEQRAHFALWALMKSPLMLGTDITKMSEDQKSLVGNSEILAINQDDLGVPGDLVWKEGPAEVYAGPLADGSRVVVMLNRHTLATQYKYSNITVKWEWIGLTDDTEASVRNLLDKKDMGTAKGSFTGEVIVHDALMVKITPKNKGARNTDWRAWNARTYVQPGGGGGGSKAAKIALIVLLALVLLAAVVLLGSIFITKGFCGCCRRRGSKFGRLEEEKAHRSPSGKLQLSAKPGSRSPSRDLENP